jgi:hypothetical protein
MKAEKLETEENQQPTDQDILDRAHLQKVLATRTMTVIHPFRCRSGLT